MSRREASNADLNIIAEGIETYTGQLENLPVMTNHLNAPKNSPARSQIKLLNCKPRNSEARLTNLSRKLSRKPAKSGDK